MIYLDACIVIYLVEQHPVWRERIRNELASAATTLFAISPLVQLECLVGPLRQNEGRLQRAYQNAFQQFVTLDMPDTVYIDAAELRARSALRTPDALHLACARHHECLAVWTNDDRLKKASRGLARNVLQSKA